MQLDFGSYEEIITRSLFFWYGCLTMDKICRKFDVNEIPTPHTLRIIITRSLFFWYGCLTMDKICRKFDVNEIPTPHTLRIQTMIL